MGTVVCHGNLLDVFESGLFEFCDGGFVGLAGDVYHFGLFDAEGNNQSDLGALCDFRSRFN